MEQKKFHYEYLETLKQNILLLGSRLDFYPWKAKIDPCEPLNLTAGEPPTKAIIDGRYFNVPKNPARYLRLHTPAYLKHVTWTTVEHRQNVSEAIWPSFGKCRDYEGRDKNPKYRPDLKK